MPRLPPVGRLRSFVLTLVALVAFGVPAVVGSTPASAATAIPRHVFGPYFETWTSDSIATIARQSGDRYFTLAFLETLGRRSCTLAWNGDRARTIDQGGYLDDIAKLREMGGDVIPSFGGWSADQGGTEIGDSCSSVKDIAAAYESVVTTYDVTRLDMDIEGRSLARTDGIDRRNKAIKRLQDWARAHGRTLQIQFTLPTSADGLEPSGVAVLQNAIANGVRVDVVNPMVFDYYDGVTTDMGAAAISASKGLHAQLATLYPAKTSAQRWAMQGATIMNGVDDYPKKTEVTTLADARQLRRFATRKGMSTLSMWSIQRDNTSSGIAQSPWAFSHVLAPFTGP
jgi:Glycosyl hydrolases family 18